MASQIKAIPTQSVHRITSGQVVIDLQTAVKELVENSLDAGATSIEVRFKEYGLRSIEVIDNGSGIKLEDYEAIGLKHHTSKLASYADLSTVNTFGFRGEAISSLCALAESVSIVTATEDEAPMGTTLELDKTGRLTSSSTKVARQRGTTVTITNVFAPLPVRRAELTRNIKREHSKALALLTAYALVPCSRPPGVRLTVSNQPDKGKKAVQIRTDGSPNLRNNVSSLWGKKTLDGLRDIALDLEVEGEKSMLKRAGLTSLVTTVRCTGLMSPPLHPSARTSADRQHLFLNSRPCVLPKIQKAIAEVWHCFCTHGHGMWILDFVLPTDAYDVNVSPDKRTILLHNEENVVIALKAALESFWAPTRSTFTVNGASGSRPKASQKPGSDDRESETEEEAVEEEDELKDEDDIADPATTVRKPKSTPKPVAATRTRSRGDTQPESERPKRKMSELETLLFESSDEDEADAPQPEDFISQRLDADAQVPASEQVIPLSETVDRSPAILPAHPSADTDVMNAVEDHNVEPSATPKVETVASAAGSSDVSLANGVSPLLVGGTLGTLGDDMASSPSLGPLESPSPVGPNPSSHAADDTKSSSPFVYPSNPPSSQPASTQTPPRPQTTVLSTLNASWSRGRPSPHDERPKKRLKVSNDSLNQTTLTQFQRRLRTFASQGSQQEDLEMEEPAEDEPADAINAESAAEDEYMADENDDQPADSDVEMLSAPGDESIVTPSSDLEELPPSLAVVPKRSRERSMSPGLRAGLLEESQVVDLTAEEDDEIQHIVSVRGPTRKGQTPGEGTSKMVATQPSSPQVKAVEILRRGDDLKSRMLFDLERVRSRWARIAALGAEESARLQSVAQNKDATAAGLGTDDAEQAERALSRVISKADFDRMEILGQFNLGFVIVRLRRENDGESIGMDELFIVDQHAADEKYNFETLQQTTRIQSQALFRPRPLELTPADELMAMENLDILRSNGFDVEIDASDDEEMQGERQSRIKLTAQPVSKETVFDMKDFEELLHLMQDAPKGQMVRCSKARSMFAMRACRKSVMIGKALTVKQMTSVVRHMGTMEQPWNCPHGRPTMRHLLTMDDVLKRLSRKPTVDWRRFDL